MPVIQPYRTKNQNSMIETIIQKVSIYDDSDNLPISKSKQQTAFPPNFVHSLDSTHMMYTCIRCHEENITFAAVHDSYWTHAASLDRISELLREEFVRLHSQPLLEDLRSSLQRRYPDITFPDVPHKGKLDLKEVLKSRYFFS